jgi:hypothetical protein
MPASVVVVVVVVVVLVVPVVVVEVVVVDVDPAAWAEAAPSAARRTPRTGSQTPRRIAPSVPNCPALRGILAAEGDRAGLRLSGRSPRGKRASPRDARYSSSAGVSESGSI